MARDKTPKEKKQRWYHQVWQAYRMTAQTDPATTWVLLAVFFSVIGIGVILGLTVFNLVTAIIMFIPLAVLATMFMLTRRAERAAYKRIEGQAGAARSALGTVRGGWTFEDEPVAINKSQDLVFRGAGRPGVILVSEGPAHRVTRMLEDERKKAARVLPNVPITLIQVGSDEGQVPLPKLARTVRKLKAQLTRAEVAEVTKRLRALGGMKLGIPKGIDPTKARPDRKGLKGR
ncbi:MAG: DUF4191 domain-containing protein [Promicromonosporaceae bacterium]|nr:DUF4191 domain-containing protein [Promicromonosporaceae bacterium]